MVRHTLTILQQMLQDFKVCLIILRRYALKGQKYFLFFKIFYILNG